MKKKTPKFDSESEERRFWQQNDSAGYIDWDDAEKVVLPRLKPSTVMPGEKRVFFPTSKRIRKRGAAKARRRM